MCIELTPLFSVPVIKFKFSKHNNYKFPTVNRHERIPDGWELSLNSTYPEIEDDDPLVPRKIRESMERDLYLDTRAVLKKLGISYDNIFIKDFWYNIYHEEQGQEPHDHLGNAGDAALYWSCIYYNRGATPTKFHNAHRYMKLCMPVEIQEDSPLADMYVDMWENDVQNGDVVLFPPWVIHEVVPQKHVDEMRLTFTFNIGYNHEC